MPKQTQTISVGLASPGGLAVEREAIERLCERISTAMMPESPIALQVIRWERVPPQVGRPQASINTYLDECDIFVGLLHRRFGEPTGETDSGFLEEFERALARRDGSDEPEIGIFFKRVDDASLSDPGPDLQRVIRFRERVKRERIALYSEFGELHELVEQATGFLLQNIWRHISSVTESESAPITPASPLADNESTVPADLFSTVHGLGNLMGGSPADVDWDRLQLFATSTGRDSDPIPVHLLNRVYLRRRETRLTVSEYEAWARTYLAELGRVGRARTALVVPFWGLGDPSIPKVPDLVDTAFLATLDEGQLRGVGHILFATGDRPAAIWPPRGTSEVSLRFWNEVLTSPTTRRDASEYLLRVGSVGDRDLLDSLAERLDSSAAARLSRLRSSLVDGDHLGLLETELGSSPGSDKALVSRIKAAISSNPSAEVLKSLVESKIADRWIREQALQQLTLADSPPAGTVITLLRADTKIETELTQHAVASLAPEDWPQVIEAVTTGWIAWSKKEFAHRVALFTTKSSTDHILQIDSITADDDFDLASWEAISSLPNPPARALQLARKILNRSVPQLDAQIEVTRQVLGTPRGEEVAEWELATARLAALKIIAKLPRTKVTAADREHFRDEIKRGNWLTRRHVVLLFSQVCTRNDLRFIVAHLKELEVDEQRAAGQRLVELASKPDLVRLVDDGPEEVAVIALGRIRELKSSTQKWLREKLRSDYEAVRWEAAATLGARLTLPALDALIDEYASEKDTYYYNAVAALDEVGYGPEGIAPAGA